MLFLNLTILDSLKNQLRLDRNYEREVGRPWKVHVVLIQTQLTPLIDQSLIKVAAARL
jgi:hypothetical protein